MCLSLLLLSFKLSLGRVFRPHHCDVNQGGIQKVTPEVTLYEPRTAEHSAEVSLRRRRSGRYSKVLPGHADERISGAIDGA